MRALYTVRVVLKTLLGPLYNVLNRFKKFIKGLIAFIPTLISYIIYMKNKKIAYPRVILPSGEVLRNEVIDFDENENIVSHFPLKQELPFIEWHNETFVVEGDK